MTTTHAARRRQRSMRRTLTSTARAQPHRVAVARGPEPAVSSVSPVTAIAAEAEAAEARSAPVKPIRTPDSDDHLAAYFRQLAEHELLTPEDERELSQGIEDTEILTWERVLSRPDDR